MKNLLIILGSPFTFILKSAVIAILFITKLYSQLPRAKFSFHSAKPRQKRQKAKTKTSAKLPRPTKKMMLFFIIGIVLLNLFVLAFRWYKNLPSVDQLLNPPAQTTKILDRHGNLLYQIYRDENRTLVKLSDLPPHLIKATIAAEDKNFYTHKGIDLVGISRAFIKNLKNCRLYTKPCVQAGGSTLTQQLVKNTLLGPEKTYFRKLKEAVLAILVERKFTKEQILELYLNEVSYGGTAYGIEAASQLYFNKSARQLSLAEAALLTGLTVSPTTLSPLGRYPYLTKDRQLFVLSRMVDNGFITQQEAATAAAEPVVLKPKSVSLAAPHFVMWVKEQLIQELGEDMIASGGLTVTTTLDLNYQKILEQNIAKELARLKNFNVNNAAGLVTNPQTGEILAMAGSHNYYDYDHDGQVNVTLSPRQPGSSIKVITYALALMSGLTPNSTIEDTPVCFAQIGSPPYCPKNYDGRYHGTVNLKTALASSYNIPAVKLLNSLGINKMISLARSMGITTWEDPSRFGLSLTLGGGEVKMTDMAEVYGTFANNGYHVPLVSILEIKDHQGNILYQAAPTPKTQVIPEIVAFQINNILSDNNSRAPAFGPRSVLYIPSQQVAVKTGTTNNLRDNWTFGYTHDLLVATWVGNNDNAPMSRVASGITGASPIWRNTMDALLKDKPKNTFTPPQNAKKVALCRETRTIYCQDICPSPPIYEYFIPGTEPKDTCQKDKGAILPQAAIN